MGLFGNANGFGEEFLFKNHRLIVHISQKAAHRVQKFSNALSADGRNGEYFDTFWLKFLFNASYWIASAYHVHSIAHHVNFIGRYYLRTCGNLRVIGFQFFINRIDIRNGVTAFRSGGIHHMDHNLCALNML